MKAAGIIKVWMKLGQQLGTAVKYNNGLFVRKTFQAGEIEWKSKATQ